MIRFRNPGTDKATQIRVIKLLYENLSEQQSFTLEEIAEVVAIGNGMTAYGYAGEEALRLSDTDDLSRNSTYNNAKMYAEVFRQLGWVTPYGEKSYPLVFTLLGAHMAQAETCADALYEQCVIGMVNPTDISGRMAYSEQSRYFKAILRTFEEMDDCLYKHELCLGPLSIDDNEQQFGKMINRLKSLRGSYPRLTQAFNALSTSLSMKPSSVDNCTRLPVALLYSCGLVEDFPSEQLFNKKLKCMKITPHGRAVHRWLTSVFDVRLDWFRAQKIQIQQAIIRLGFYNMLEHAGYETEEVKTIIEADKKTVASVVGDKEILFSPCQVLRHEEVNQALGGQLSSRQQTERILTTRAAQEEREREFSTTNIFLREKVECQEQRSGAGQDLASYVAELKQQGLPTSEIIDHLFAKSASFTQKHFYPFVADLFCLAGYDCEASRAGVNGARWDAIIKDEERSIPIEIKSPTEEMHLSIKAIRQSLENKIMLLSRQTYKTTPEVTSLAVGYLLPNDRAEVQRLIADIKSTFGFKIGVLDLKSLITIAVSATLENSYFDKEQLIYAEGLIYAHS